MQLNRRNLHEQRETSDFQAPSLGFSSRSAAVLLEEGSSASAVHSSTGASKSLTQPADAHRMPSTGNLKAEHLDAQAVRRSCERICPQHLFSKEISSREILRINRSCGICAHTPRAAGRQAWCRGDEFWTNHRLRWGGMWTGGYRFTGSHNPSPDSDSCPHGYPQVCITGNSPEKFSPRRPNVRFQTTKKTSGGITVIPCSHPTSGGAGPPRRALRRDGRSECQRLERCLIRAVSSWTWSYTLRRSVISLRIFLSAYMTVVWSRPNVCPIFGSERSVSSRQRYMAI